MTLLARAARGLPAIASHIAGTKADKASSVNAFSPIFWCAMGAIFAVAAIFQLTHPTIADNSWLFVVDNRWLDGEWIYRDFVETNPPMSAFLYMPAVLVERSGLMSADAAQVFITLALLAGSFAASARLLLRVRTPEDVSTWLLVAGMMFVCIPTSMFAEREHIALVLLLPGLALMELRAAHVVPHRSIRTAIGFAAGLAVCIKPHFALAVLAPQIWLCVRIRSIRPLYAAENWLTALVVVLYVAIVICWFRSYLTDVVPMLAETYRLTREPLGILIFNLALIVSVGAAVAAFVVLGRGAKRPAIMIPMLAAVGFLFAFFEQGKGWLNHLYPTLALSLVAFLSEAVPELLRGLGKRDVPLWRKAVNCTASSLLLYGLWTVVPALKNFDPRGLELGDRLTSLHPHPRLFMLSMYLSTGQPLTRAIGARWIGHFGHQFITEAATEVPKRRQLSSDQQQRLELWLKHDRDLMAEDIRAGRPDIILVDQKYFPWQQLLASGHEVVGLLDHYRRVDTINEIDILVPISSDAGSVAAHPRAG